MNDGYCVEKNISNLIHNEPTAKFRSKEKPKKIPTIHSRPWPDSQAWSAQARLDPAGVRSPSVHGPDACARARVWPAHNSPTQTMRSTMDRTPEPIQEEVHGLHSSPCAFYSATWIFFMWSMLPIDP